MTTRDIFEHIQYLDRICAYYEPKMVCNYGMVITDSQAEAQKRYSKADAKRKELIGLLEERVYKANDLDNEIINRYVEKELEEIQGKKSEDKKKKRNVRKVKKEDI